jgi:formyl-CoA transferase
LAGAAKAPPRRAPAIGQHSEELLREAGYAADEIGRLRSLGVLG